MSIVQKIREHPEIGKGSCHPWDECYSDAELEDHLSGKSYEEAVALGLAVLDVFNDRIADAENSAF